MKSMTKQIYISLSLLTVAASLLGACTKLNQVSSTNVPASRLFKDTASLNEAVVGLYSTLEVQEYYGAYYPMLADLNSDNGIAGGYNNTSLNEFGAHSVTSSNIFIQNMYVALYYTVATANGILSGDKAITDTAAQVRQTEASAEGQALAIRALAHFDLLRAFGYHWDTTSAYGIPIVTTVQTASDIVPRSTVAASYASIISDLQTAAQLLNGSPNRSPYYINPAIINALLARVYLYKQDYAHAAFYAGLVINDGAFSLLDPNNFPSIYNSKGSKESIFELPFNQQNQSEYNISTYARPGAASTEVLFIASQALQTFFQSRPADLRINLLDYNSPNFQPNGRTLKYSSDITQKDNSAYVVRIAEMYLIRAEALGRTAGLSDLNMVRVNRGLAALAPSDVTDDPTYAQAVADENRAEFNFEGHRYFDLARTGQVANVLGATASNSVNPIPLAQITATHGKVVQNPGY
jgi:hypothetical protein